ncbi:Retrovirus-related Pol polyprotein from transposon 17.6 [Labeo rohita]|uniref:ribonuclease H n=1 Tax=Labeo rohita TaxID=84645 RepID=A0ABQ8LA55_LABRO|nr:Retrovirus-related Pol polyprotein from transposon 17.6 [Labeo rohita]
MDLLLQAHKLHAVLGPSIGCSPQLQASSVPPRNVHCFKCSLPGFTTCTCPNCSQKVKPRLPPTEPPNMPSDDVNREPKAGRMDGSDQAIEDGEVDSGFNQRGNYRGGRMFRWGNPPSRRTVVLGDEQMPLEEFEGADRMTTNPDLLCVGVSSSTLSMKVEEASLNNEQKSKLTELLKSFSGLFNGHFGHTTLELIESQIKNMLEEGIIEPASGPWAAPVVIVPKQSGEPRFCVNYRGLNKLTVKDSYPLPRIDESLNFLARGTFISTIDLSRGYWQVAMAENSKQKTAFISHCGLFQFWVLPFGLCKAPSTFQRLMNTVLAGLIYKSCAVYLDDIVVASPTFEQHLVDLKEVLARLESAGLSVKLEKCQFCRSELTFLGYSVTTDGVRPNEEKTFRFLSLSMRIHAMLAALKQRDNNGRDVVVAYASRALHKAERPYSTPEKECLAVIWALEHFRPYVGLHVTIFSDHSSLRWLMSRPNLSGQLARWSLRLQDFDFDIV